MRFTSCLRGLATAAALLFSMSAMAEDAPMSIPGAATVDAKGVIKLVEGTANLVILDNRKESDFNDGHIEGAKRLIDTDITGPEVLAKAIPAKDTPALFYCNGLKCGRAAKAAKMAVDAGYSKVHYYALGMDDWRAQGLPLIKK